MTPAKRRPRNTGGLHQRKSDGMWIGSVDFGHTPQGTRDRRDRRTVSSMDESLAQEKLDALVAERDALRSPLLRAAESLKPEPGYRYTLELDGGRPVVSVEPAAYPTGTELAPKPR